MTEENDSTHETVRRLEQRLEQASEKAQRLAEAALGAVPLPPAGFQAAEDEAARDPGLDALLETVRALRELIPSDLQRRLADALRELLVAVRALLDWYIERLEHRQESPGEVQDIPIL